jgi:5-methylcytosine-specific restriction endonuclease McrBC GTP-binding regulatory subunit McrB
MNNPFNLSEEKLVELLRSYDAWLKSYPDEAKYPEEIKKKSKKIKDEFLNAEVLPRMSDDELYDKIYKYSRHLEGPVHIRLGEPRIRGCLSDIRRNLKYIMTSKDAPVIIAENILEGKYKIPIFAKGFWSPILLAQFPDKLPNWNNKTEHFLKKFGINISTSKLSISERYQLLSNAFTFLSALIGGHDFYTINHLMHYGTVIKEGKDLIAKLQGSDVINPIIEMIKMYKERIRQIGLEDELYKWKLLKKYRGKPDPSIEDFFNEITSINFGNLIYYNANRVKNHIASKFPDEFRNCFIKLYDEKENLISRVKGFTNEVLAIYRKLEPKLSCHHDERTIAAYLTFHDPEKYTFYKDSFYQKYCKLIGVESKPRGEKYAHYMQLIIDFRNKFIISDVELIDLVNELMNSDCFKDENHLILAQDILFQMLDSGKEIPGEEEEDNPPQKKFDVSDIPLNTILYGPPGTGKTYNTIDLAVKIAAPEEYSENNHEANKVIYEKLVQTGQIVFTTFHQSLCYEDFIEGIKPVSDDTSNLTYRIEDGLFKQLAINAAFEFVGAKSSEASKLLSFSTVYDQLIDEVNEKIGNNLGFTLRLKSGAELEIIEITVSNNFLVQHKNGSRTYTVSRKRLEKLFSELPDLDNISNINEEIRNVIGGSNSSAYWAVLKKLRSYKGEVQTSGKKFSYEDKAAAVEKLLPEDVVFTGNERRYVMIIDEINRGNVSQVFGELITLIEEDKRFGNKERLSAKLPYSRSRFFVPPNMYIIGTMNTADRSVEALDTALRRRFSFIEMVPLYNLEGMEKIIAENKVSDLLETINGRIEKLIDRDHRIGHSYFLGLNTLPELMIVFKIKIVPLLQEYFYGNYEKMGLVLGKSFIEKLPDEKVKFASFPADDNDFNDKVIYRINTKSLNDPEEFTNAIALLMNK